MGALTGVKVGDEVVIDSLAPRSVPRRTTAEKVGPKYIHVDGVRYHVNSGEQASQVFGYALHCFTIAQWERRMLERELYGAMNKLTAGPKQIARVSDDDLRAATRMLEEVAKKIGATS